jgi:hypothetical protein
MAMRSLLALSMSMLVVSLAAVGCTAPSVGSFDGDDSEHNLPDRTGDDDDDDDTTASSKTSGSTTTGTGTSTQNQTATKQTLTVTSTGDGAGAVTSEPSGVTCTDGSCKGDFASGTKVTLTAQPKAGSIFAGWTGGGCTGTTTCTTTLATASTVTAQFITLAGTWTGTYSHSQKNGNCTFNNKGNLQNTMAGSTSFTTAAQMNGFEIRNLSDCSLQGGLRDGSAGPSAATVSGNTVTGTWNIQISGISGSLPLPFTATIVGNKMSGKWTCTGCTGTFDISKQ